MKKPRVYAKCTCGRNRAKPKRHEPDGLCSQCRRNIRRRKQPLPRCPKCGRARKGGECISTVCRPRAVEPTATFTLRDVARAYCNPERFPVETSQWTIPTSLPWALPVAPDLERQALNRGLTRTTCPTCGEPAWQEPVLTRTSGAETRTEYPVRCHHCGPARCA